MQTMNISLPDPMKQYVEEQVSAGGYGSASEYVRELVRADQKYKAKEQLEQTLLDALNSGDPLEITPRMWNEVRQNLRARAKERRSAQALMARYTLRPRAWREINAHLEYLEEQADLETAERFLENLTRTFEGLARMPRQELRVSFANRRRGASVAGESKGSKTGSSFIWSGATALTSRRSFMEHATSNPYSN
jgi:antitoxin ParD1/3/4